MIYHGFSHVSGSDGEMFLKHGRYVIGEGDLRKRVAPLIDKNNRAPFHLAKKVSFWCDKVEDSR